MMLSEEKLNKNYKRKDTPRELLLLRKRDPRQERNPRRREETSSETSLREWKNHSRRLMMPGPDKRKNSPSRQRNLRKKKKMTNEVFETFVSYT